MDFSSETDKKNTEESGTFQSTDLLSKMLPLLTGGKVEPDMFLKILSQNNPKLSGILQFMPLLSLRGETEKKKTNVKNYNYVKIEDYYKNN